METSRMGKSCTRNLRVQLKSNLISTCDTSPSFISWLVTGGERQPRKEDGILSIINFYDKFLDKCIFIFGA